MLEVLITFILLCSLGHSLFVPPTQFGSTIRDLYSKSYYGDMMLQASQWKAEGIIPQRKLNWCDSGQVLGDFGPYRPQGSFTRTYEDLPSHNIIYFDIGVKLIGNWMDNQDSFTIEVNGSVLKSFSILEIGNSDKISGCGGDNDLYPRLVGHFYHSASSVTVSFSWDLSNEGSDFAIEDVGLTLKSTSQSPGTNPDNALLTLTDTLVTVNLSNPSDDGKTNCPTGDYNDGVNCVKCHSGCQDCFGPSSSECYQCKWGYSFDGTQCVKCADNCGVCSGDNINQCLLCNPDYTLDFDGTCNAENTCNTPPFVIKKNDIEGYYNGFVSICTYACQGFMRYDYTCSGSCDAPLVQTGAWPVSCGYPCRVYQYLMEDGSCLSSCPNGTLPRTEGLYGFCDLDAPSPGCELSDFYKYQNGSCLGECPYPYVKELNDEGSFCNLPCSLGYFVPSSGDCVETCKPSYAWADYNILYCGPNTSNFTNGCLSALDFKYTSNDSCLPTCSYPHKDISYDGIRYCSGPCPNTYFDAANGICVSSCEPEYIRYEVDITYCDKKSDLEDFSVNIGVYIRYNISLSDFNEQNYTTKFIQLLADLLEVDPSDVNIVSLREGSTIIQSEVVLTSESDSESIAATKTKASAMIQKLTTAAESKDLDLGGVSVLNSHFTGATPGAQVKEDQAKSEKSSSKKVVLIVVVGIVGGACVIAALTVLIYELKRASRKIAIIGRAKDYKIEEIVDETGTKNQKKDEETSILGEVSRIQPTENSRTHPLENSVNDMSKTESFHLAIKSDLEHDQDSSPKKLKIQAKKEKPKQQIEVESVKPVSFREIMKNIV